jgi:hypothetical protein
MIALLVVLFSLAIVFFTLVKSGPSSFRDGPFRQAGREVKRQRQEYEDKLKSENEKSGDQ